MLQFWLRVFAYESSPPILQNRKELFINKTLPKIFKQMKQLDISIEDIIKIHNKD